MERGIGWRLGRRGEGFCRERNFLYFCNGGFAGQLALPFSFLYYCDAPDHILFVWIDFPESAVTHWLDQFEIIIQFFARIFV